MTHVEQMPEIQPTPFTVQITGSAVIPHQAERGVIDVQVQSSGTNKVAVVDEVLTTTRHIESLLQDLSPQDPSPESKLAAPLAHWSKCNLSSTSHVPYNSDGQAQSRIYDASVSFDIRFREFKALGAFGATVAALPFTTIQKIDWTLTNATNQAYKSQLRKAATRDAVVKARDYCAILGCDNLRPVELMEGSMQRLSGRALGASHAWQTAAPMQMSRRGGRQSTGREENTLEFTPQEVKMSMEVTVKFHADPPESGLEHQDLLSKSPKGEDEDTMAT